MNKFNLEKALLDAEAGDVALWEDIARHLLAKAKPKAKKGKSTGPQTWAHVVLAYCRENPQPVELMEAAQ